MSENMNKLNDEQMEYAVGAGANGPYWWDGGCCYYRIVGGDTLSEIALRFGTSIWAIQQLNPGQIPNPDFIRAGQVIRIY